MNSKRMLLRLLRLGLLSLFFVYQTTPALSIIEESVKELIVERRSDYFDSFTVKMKTDRTCNHVTCTSLGALYVRFAASGSSCECHCWNYRPFTFLSSIQRCANTTQVRDFGGCDEYLNGHPILSFMEFGLSGHRQPLNLITASSVRLSARQATSCTFNQKYSVHDYSGFQSRWGTISDRFFNLTVTSRNGEFNLNWKADSNGTLSGKIIRIPITCTNAAGSSSTPCFLVKAKGTVTYYAPPTPTVSSSSSTTGQSSLSSHLPLSSPILFTSSVLSPSPSLIGILSTKPSKAIITAVSSTSATSSGPGNGTVIGSAVGGALGLGIVVVLSLVICWKRRKPGSVLVETPVYANPGNEIQLETTNKSYTSLIAQDNQPTYQGLLNDNRQSNVAARYNSAEGNYANCPVYQALNEKNPGTPVYQLPVYQSNGQPTNSSNEIQLETPKARTSPIAQEHQPTYQGLLNENRQSNLAATYNRAEGSYENCPVYQTLNKKNPGTPVYQSPVHQSEGLPEGASRGINEEQDGHGTQYEPLRRP